MSKDQKRNIYDEDRLFAAEGKTGWYLAFTTKDPSEKFKMRRIAEIDGRPPKDLIEEKEVKNDKIRYYLDKEKSAEFIEDNYKYFIVNKPSPWNPKKFGEKRPVSATDSDDSDSDVPTKKQKVAVVDPENQDLTLKTVKDCYALLLEISSHIRHLSGGDTRSPDGDQPPPVSS